LPTYTGLWHIGGVGLLRIQDKSGRTKFVLRDEDEEPLSIDELVLNDQSPEEKEEDDHEQDGD
jgi:hypothetical protein